MIRQAPTRERGAVVAAIVATALLHCMLLAVAWTPGTLGTHARAPALQVIYIEAPVATVRQLRNGDVKVEPRIPSAGERGSPVTDANDQARDAGGASPPPARETRRAADPGATTAIATGHAIETETHSTAGPDVAADGRTRALVTTLPDAGVRFRTRDAFDPTADPDVAAASHLKVTFKPVVTPENVVREVARGIGLWPPGYTDRPCPAIRKTLEQVRNGEYVADPAEVDAILKSQARHCP